MIIKTFLTQRNVFIISKRLIKNGKADLIGNYQRILEKSIILSLFITLILFRILPMEKSSTARKDHLNLTLEAIDIPITKQETPPPPPPVPEVIKNYTVIIKNDQIDSRKRRESLEEVKLNLNIETDDNLLANSQIDDITYSAFRRVRTHNDRGVSLNINSDVNALSNHLNSEVDFNLSRHTTTKKSIDNTVELDIPNLTSVPDSKNSEPGSKKIDTDLIQITENQFLLKESESTIGTNEYRLWNKINAALDRLDKNRFGNLPQNVQRTTTGLSVFFRYNNGVQHEIFWSKGGKVVIRVTGTRPREISDELQRALDSLIRLTI